MRAAIRVKIKSPAQTPESQRIKAEVIEIAKKMKECDIETARIRLRNQMVVKSEPLIRKILNEILDGNPKFRRIKDQAIEKEDLIQEAFETALKKASEYDPLRAAPSTFFWPWIWSTITYTLTMSGLIQIPSCAQKKLQELRDSGNEACVRFLNREELSTDEEKEVKRAMGWNDLQFENTKDLFFDFSVRRLDAYPRFYWDMLLKGRLEFSAGQCIDEERFRKAVLEIVNGIPGRTENQKRSFYARIFEERKLPEIARELGITVEAVRKAVNRIIDDLIARRHRFRQFV